MDKARGRHLRKLIILISENDFTNTGRQMEAPYRNLDLSAKVKPKLSIKRTVKAWGPRGQTLEFAPLCHVSLVLPNHSDDSITILLGS